MHIDCVVKNLHSCWPVQVSSGTVDQAKKLIDKILRQCNKPLMDDEQVSSPADAYCNIVQLNFVGKGNTKCCVYNFLLSFLA